MVADSAKLSTKLEQKTGLNSLQFVELFLQTGVFAILVFLRF
jgi:hypothetical protein